MEKTYWQAWEKGLSRLGLKPLACLLLTTSRPLLPVAAQMMVMGTPIIKSFSWGAQYSALIRMMDDEDQIRQFCDYLNQGAT